MGLSALVAIAPNGRMRARNVRRHDTYESEAGLPNPKLRYDWSKHPSGHSAWVFDSPGEFEAGATRFFASAPPDERLMFIADDPGLRRWPRSLIDSGRLRLASTSDVYGPDHVVDPAAQRATFAAVLDEAVADGYTSIRVAADNTSLLLSPEQFAAWSRWERVADAFMAEYPVTGMCGFDRSRLHADELREMILVHPHYKHSSTGTV